MTLEDLFWETEICCPTSSPLLVSVTSTSTFWSHLSLAHLLLVDTIPLVCTPNNHRTLPRNLPLMRVTKWLKSKYCSNTSFPFSIPISPPTGRFFVVAYVFWYQDDWESLFHIFEMRTCKVEIFIAFLDYKLRTGLRGEKKFSTEQQLFVRSGRPSRGIQNPAQCM